MRIRWRIWLVHQLDRMARAIDFFSLGIMRPDDIVEWNRRYYSNPAIVSNWSKAAAVGLRPEEEMLLDRFAPSVGKALVLGCGGGREAIALAKRGWEVVAVDNSPALIAEAKANGSQSGVEVDWRCQDVTEERALDPAGRFDLVCLLGQLYTLIPGRRSRVELLKSCRRMLKLEGICLVTFNTVLPPSPGERMAQACRKLLAWLVWGNRECQLGDHWFYGQAFHHFFSSLEEVLEEAALAGLVMMEGNKEVAPRQGAAVLKRVNQPAPVEWTKVVR